MSLPEPTDLTWLECDEYQRILFQASSALRERHPDAARHLDYRAAGYRTQRNHLAEAGK